MRRARLSVFQGRASDSKNSPHPNEPFTGQDMLYSRPKYALNHMGCDLKHNFAVWQRYALNDLHFPIDCVLNAYRAHPQNLGFLSNNRKVAVPECDGASHQVVLAAKLCFQPRKRCGRTSSENRPVAVHWSGNIMLSTRQRYALNDMGCESGRVFFGGRCFAHHGERHTCRNRRRDRLPQTGQDPIEYIGRSCR